MLKRNLIANYLGQGWVTLMGLIFIPQYLELLGIEAYGLIGLYTLLTTWMNLLDMGLTPALGREMSSFSGGGRDAQFIRDLLRTVELIIFGIALLITLSIGLASSWMANEWIKSDSISADVITQAFLIMGFVVAARFTEAVYRSTIVGLQRQVLFNIVNSLMATVRGVGSVMILVWLSPTIQAFFIFQALISVATLLSLGFIAYRILPQTERAGHFSFHTLKQIWKFTSGMMIITFLALISTQIDKILISKILPLSEFAYYSLAATIAGSVYMMIGPITQAYYPKFCELHAGGKQLELIDAYHKSAQLITVVAGVAAILILFFTKELLHIWGIDGEVIRMTENIIKVLVVGNLLNGLTHIPFQMQLAHGWTGLATRLLIVSTLIVLPALLLIIPSYGIEGAAWIWLGLSIVCLVVTAELMYKSILKNEKWHWYFGDIMSPLVAAVLSVALVKWIFGPQDNTLNQILLIVATGFVALIAGGISSSHLRATLIKKIRLYSNNIYYALFR